MSSPHSSPDLSSHLPLHPADYSILLALASGELHGYGILKEVGTASSGDVELDPGNLYRRLRRLLNAEWVERLETPTATDGEPRRDERRRPYRLTELGRDVAAAETARLRRLVDSQAARVLSAEATQ